MKAMQKMKVIKIAFALAALLAMSGNGWAKPGGGGGGTNGDLNGSRDSVLVLLPVDACTAVLNHTYSVKAYIFQPSGRIFAVGIGNATFTCQTGAQYVSMTVDAFPGLTFKPGPATLIFQVLDTNNTNPSVPVTTIVDEQGSRIDLH